MRSSMRPRQRPSSSSSLFFRIFLCMVVFSHIGYANSPHPWQIGFQPAASPMMEGITHMHNILLVIITIIALVVGGLLSYVTVRFRAARNPIPSKTSHHTLLEVVWTMIPVLILIATGIPSLKLLYSLEKVHDAKMTIKAIGHQWYWSYEYPEMQISYDSYMVEDKDLKPGQMRLLSVDNPIYVPTDTIVRVLISSQDVLHSFAVPSLGVKKDAVPGRINETWFSIAKEGDYYGQCSELCGNKHGFMPIHVKAVSPASYAAWVKSKGGHKKEESKLAPEANKDQPEAKSGTETKASTPALKAGAQTAKAEAKSGTETKASTPALKAGAQTAKPEAKSGAETKASTPALKAGIQTPKPEAKAGIAPEQKASAPAPKAGTQTQVEAPADPSQSQSKTSDPKLTKAN